MPDIGPTDPDRLHRLRELSDQLAAAMGEVLAFEARVTAALVAIERSRAASLEASRQAASRAGRGPGDGTRKRARRAA